MTNPNAATFADLALSAPLLQALQEIGYETPSPIQMEGIPPLLAGADILGQAQTGTGKTAAFALPLLHKLDLARREPQVLVLAPTRELAIQVAEAFQAYARHLPSFHVLPIYGGQSIEVQLRHLKRGVHVVVGTPGRIMDHLRRKSLSLDGLTSLVLDEADEMLRMGFIEDVEWILEHTPAQRQVALFSATMPPEIRKVAQRHLREPQEIKIKARTSTVENIRQRYLQVNHKSKLDALTRVLEAEDFDAALIFVRTKTASMELTERLEARGYACAALNGDMTQAMRERTVEQLKNEKLEIVIATDVAARGIDVKRISLVINYDIPNDIESYVHRIGRTGRAGRTGDAILFAAPREMRMLNAIEKATKQPIEAMQLPCAQTIANKRISQFKQQLTEILEAQELDFFRDVVEQYQQENDVGATEIAAALTFLLQRERPLQYRESRSDRSERPERPERSEKFDKRTKGDAPARADRPKRQEKHPDIDMVRYRIEVGRNHNVSPGDIVGAIANEAGIDSEYIGQIKLYDDHSTVDLPDGMPKDLFQHLKRVRVRNQPLDISVAGDTTRESAPRKYGAERPRPAKRDGDSPPRKHARVKGKPSR